MAVAECNNPCVANRDRHRQGLVYGPVRPQGPRDRGRIVGNLLGLLVVVVTVSVLALAIYFFIQARSAQPIASSATASPPASGVPATSGASPGPSASLVAIASGLITPAPSLIATIPPSSDPPVTPAPTLYIPAVVTGPGFITFGTTADAQLHVTDPKTTFAVDEPMIWSAYLTRPANSVDLRIRIYKLDATQPTGLALVREDLVMPVVNSTQRFFLRLRPIGASAGAGLFTIEYIQGDEVLSQGSFLVQ
jgi:hypothetical protein